MQDSQKHLLALKALRAAYSRAQDRLLAIVDRYGWMSPKTRDMEVRLHQMMTLIETTRQDADCAARQEGK